jgi:hypothetical protein
MLESQIDQAERRATLRNDALVREQEERRRVFAPNQSEPKQSSTYFQHAQADAQTPRGRFSAVEAQTVVGANPAINYPAGSAWCADPGSQLLEPPLGFDNSALEEPSTALAVSPVEAPDPTSDAPSTGLRDVGSLSHSGDPAPEVLTQRISQPQRVGSPVSYRRF